MSALGLRVLCLSLPLAVLGYAGMNGARAQGDGAAAETRALAMSDYVEHCGGCHGIQGDSAPAEIPVLRNRIGYFLCTPQARAYLLRVPNVAHSRLHDNAQLAELMNFAVFRLGGPSVPSGAQPFTAAEVARERGNALSTASLKRARSAAVESVIRACKAPSALRLFYPGQTTSQKN